jgi:hypothetical protein
VTLPPQNRPKPFDRARLRDLWASGATCAAIGLELGCSKALVSRRAQRLGLPRRTTDPTQLPVAKIKAAYLEHGMTLEAIRDQLRLQFPLVSVLAIRHLLMAHGVKMRPRWHANKRRSEYKAAECVRLARQGLKFAAIGRMVGLTARQVGCRVNRVLPRLPRRELSRIYGLERIRKAYAEHGSYAKAAKAIGCHWSTVRYHVARRKDP